MIETREPAVIDYVRDDDERGWTHWIGVKGPSGGWGQGFGGIGMDPEHLADWKAQIASLFGVTDVESVVGRQCFVLRNWAGLNEPIEGLEVDGRRFTITDFRRKHWPEKALSQLENRKAVTLNDIDFHARRIREETEVLRKLSDGYTEWASSVHSKGDCK